MDINDMQKLVVGKPGHVAIERHSNHYRRTVNGAWIGNGGTTDPVRLVPEGEAINWMGGEHVTLVWPDGYCETWDLASVPCRFSNSTGSMQPRIFHKGYYRPEPLIEEGFEVEWRCDNEIRFREFRDLEQARWFYGWKLDEGAQGIRLSRFVRRAGKKEILEEVKVPGAGL